MAQRRSLTTKTLVVLASILLATSALAQTSLQFTACAPGSTAEGYVLVPDLRSAPTASARSAVFLSATHPVIKQLDALRTSKCPDKFDDQTVTDTLKNVLTTPTATARLITNKDDTITVYAFVKGVPFDVQILEKGRKPKIWVDLGNLIDLVRIIGPAAAKTTMGVGTYQLHEDRGELYVSAVPIDVGSGKAGSPIQIATALTGSREQWSLSANVPVNTVKMVTLNDQHELELKDAPKEFLVGLDWYYGDVLTDNYAWWAPERFGAKLLFKFDKQPLETIGFVGAWRYTGFSVIAGPVWIHQPHEVTESGTVRTIDERYEMDWRIGMGFDILKAKDWLTKKK